MDEQRARDDLAVIRRLMEDGRREVVERGAHFVIWGVVSAVGSLVTYAYVAGMSGLPGPTVTWSVLLLAGWAGSIVAGRRDARGARVRRLARRLLSAVWVSAAVSLTLLALAGLFGGALGYAALPGTLSIVIAAPVLVTMLLTGERWLGVVAAGWWTGGAFMLFAPGPYTLLVMAAMGLLLLAVPGLALNVKARRRASSSPETGPAADLV